MRTILTCSLIALVSQSPLAAADKPNSYNGGEPVAFETMPNGAIVNAKLGRDPYMRSDPRTIEVRPGAWIISGYALSNSAFVETPEGIVVYDTGSNIGQGEYFLREIRKVTKKPIIAIIYSHSHYTAGAKAIAEGRDIPVFGHPGLAANQRNRSLVRAPLLVRRANMQFGGYLPRTGADALVATPEPEFTDPEKLKSGFMPVTRTVADGETVMIGGMAFTFKWAQVDTNDSLTVWVPSLKTVMTNSVTNMFYPLYTLRGEEYRPPEKIIQGLDDVRALGPEHYLPVHGAPLSGREAIEARLTLHRDAYSFVFNQAVRGINLGWTPDEIVQRTRLPQRFVDEPSLNQIYSEFDYALRGVYRGLIGWFDEDTAELNPPSKARLSRSIVEGFGGEARILAAAAAATARGEYDLAAKLAGYAVDAGPNSGQARQAKAAALRQLARRALGFQAHNFYMTEALALEGKVDRFGPPPYAYLGMTAPDVVARSPGFDLVQVLESRIDPVAANGASGRLVINFDGEDGDYLVSVRDGVAEVTRGGAKGAARLSVPKIEWVNFLQGHSKPAALLGRTGPRVAGGPVKEIEAFLGWFTMPEMPEP
ncbi:MAG: MBL fold metallo-hydrolase [Sphingopyxis sp.]|nr:MBL fold metallo-hydrolase [Sphingopyxis sp.]